MSLRKFLNGRLAPLLMSSAGGDPAAGGDAAASGGGGGGTPVALTFAPDKPFAEQLPEKYRGNAAFKDIKNFDGLADSYLNAQKMIGERVALPKEGDENAWNEFYNKQGRPESFDKYNLGKRADGSDYGDQDKAFQGKILPVLHKAGISQKQLDAIRPAFDGLMAEAAGSGTKAAEAYAAEQLVGLKKEWGAAYDDNLSDAQAAIRHFGDENLIKDLNVVKDGKATGDNAALLKVMAKLGKQLREDGVIKGDGAGNGGGAMTPDEARQKIAALEKDAAFVSVWKTKGATGKVDGKDMTHDEAVAEKTRLYAFAYPQQE